MTKSITTNKLTRAIEINGVTYFIKPVSPRKKLRLLEMQKESGSDTLDAVAFIKEFNDIFESFFTDANDKKLLDELFDSLDEEDMANVMAAIMEPEKEESATDSPRS
jgi:hypothetical protein